MEFKPGNIVKMIDTYWHGSLNESRKDIGKLFVVEYSYGEKYGNGKCYGGYSILSMESNEYAIDKIRCYLSKINGLNPRSNRLDLEIKLRKGEITPDEYRKIVLGE